MLAIAPRVTFNVTFNVKARKIGRIERSAQHERVPGPRPRHVDEQRGEAVVTIARIRAQMRQHAPELRSGLARQILVDVDPSVQGSDKTGAKPIAQGVEGGSPREAQDQIENSETVERKVLDLAPSIELGQRHGCVEIVEHPYASTMSKQLGCRAPVGTVRGDDRGIGLVETPRMRFIGHAS
jgi:hypothetical protein